MVKIGSILSNIYFKVVKKHITVTKLHKNTKVNKSILWFLLSEKPVN